MYKGSISRIHKELKILNTARCQPLTFLSVHLHGVVWVEVRELKRSPENGTKQALRPCVGSARERRWQKSGRSGQWWGDQN